MGVIQSLTFSLQQVDHWLRDMGGGANVHQDQKDRKKRGGEKSNGEGGAREQEEKSGSKALDQLGNPVAPAGTRNVEAALVTTENTAARMNGKFPSRFKKWVACPTFYCYFSPAVFLRQF